MNIVFGIAIVLLCIAVMVLHTIYKEDIWEVKNYAHTKVYRKEEVDALLELLKEQILLNIKRKYIEKNCNDELFKNDNYEKGKKN